MKQRSAVLDVMMERYEQSGGRVAEACEPMGVFS